jgi:glycosyltransferase involved in cell wall biosynthesis
MNDTPLISVLMPVYNVESYIDEAIESVISQSYTNFELIIVDDGSSDSTWEKVSRAAATDSRIRLTRNAKNIQIAGSLNVALSLAKGAYIARADGDDIMEIDRLQQQFDFLTQNSHCDIVGCSLRYVDETGKLLSIREYVSDPDLLAHLARYINPIAHVWLARAEVYRIVGGYQFSSVEDYDFICRALVAGFKIANVPSYFGMRIRIRSGNTLGLYGFRQSLLFEQVRSRYKSKYITNTAIMDITEYAKLHPFLSAFRQKSFALAQIILNSARSRIRFLYFAAVIISSAISIDALRYYRNTAFSRIYTMYYVFKRSRIISSGVQQ